MPRKTTQRAPLRIAVDTGGTFTDCLAVVGGRMTMVKVFSTPDDPSRAIVEGIRRLAEPGQPVLVLHGTTVGTNTLLERKGARVAFVTTEGFEDSIEIGRQARPRLYDFFFDRIAPLVPAELRFGVPERMGPNGEIVKPLDRAAVRVLSANLREARPDAIALSLLFSFANPVHERDVAEVLTDLGVPISISHRILPEFREYERASTVVVNAYLQPVMQRYLESLAKRVAELAHVAPGVPARRSARSAAESRSSVFVMQSSGGITSLDSAAREPVRTVLSGPAGGVVGAAAMGRSSGFDRVIGFDMGGTSTDVALVDGIPRASTEAEVAGLPVRVPMLDIHTVGAGGGSLARFDAAGALRVGPESAGADPGPICYGKGTQPTVTDANLILGRLQPQRFLGGDFQLDLDRTRRITREWLKKARSGLSLEAFAAGVIRVVNATMEKAIRVVSIERGYDPRDFVLVAFGGAGGMHACELAQGLGIPRVIVPQYPGALSAFGILVSDVVKDYSRTVVWKIDGVAPGVPARRAARRATTLRSDVDGIFRELESTARAELAAEGWTGKPILERSLDVRYSGQGFELNIGSDKTSDIKSLTVKFHALHQQRYGYSRAAAEVEIVTLRLRARLPQDRVAQSRATRVDGRATRVDAGDSPALSLRSSEARATTAPVSFAGERAVKTQIVPRDSMSPRRHYSGPAIVTEYSATTVVPPGFKFALDRAGNLLIEGAPSLPRRRSAK
jgi:N-methylhydantoinase A